MWSRPERRLSSFSGAQTGVAPGVTVDHAILCDPSRFDSERAHVTKKKFKRSTAVLLPGLWRNGSVPVF
jgi:hypothetical protein